MERLSRGPMLLASSESLPQDEELLLASQAARPCIRATSAGLAAGLVGLFAVLALLPLLPLRRGQEGVGDAVGLNANYDTGHLVWEAQGQAGPRQSWTVDAEGEPWLGAGHKCLDVDRQGEPAEGTRLQLWACMEPSEDMEFIFPKKNGMIRWAAHPELCVRPNDGEVKNGALVLWACHEDWQDMQFSMPQGSNGGPIHLQYSPNLCMQGDTTRKVGWQQEGLLARMGSCAAAAAAVVAGGSQGSPGRQDPRARGLYCWTVVHANSYEPSLLSLQEAKGWGIFGCEGTEVLSDAPALGVSAIVLGADNTTHACSWGTTSTYLCNTAFFIRAWENIVATKRYLNFPWTVKVDPDAAFFPMKLLKHLSSVGHAQVFAREAVDQFARLRQLCYAKLDENATGEDSYFSDCFSHVLQVPSHVDLALLAKPDPAPAGCAGGAVCYHYLRAPADLRACYDSAK